MRFSHALFARLTPTEQIVFDVLVGLETKFEAQKAIGPFIVDFWVKKPQCIIEIDGGYHFTEEQRTKDLARQKYLIKCCGPKTRFFRFSDERVKQPNFREVLSWELYRAAHLFQRKIRPPQECTNQDK